MQPMNETENNQSREMFRAGDAPWYYIVFVTEILPYYNVKITW